MGNSKLEMLNYEKKNGYLKDGYGFIVVGMPEIQDDDVQNLLVKENPDTKNDVIVDYFELFELDYDILSKRMYNSILEFQESKGKDCKICIGIHNGTSGVFTSGMITDKQIRDLEKSGVYALSTIIKTIIREFILEVCMAVLKRI